MVQKTKSASLIVIVGPTASGKSALALEVARRFNGEIICADSRTIYKAMDIGTAKPSAQERASIPHHLLDLVEPDESFNAARFKGLARQAIQDIGDRDRVPIMVGGTGLYIDGVLFDFNFLPPADPDERKRLGELSVEELQAEIGTVGLPMPQNSHNPRHLTRTIETGGVKAKHGPLRTNTLLIGLTVNVDTLRERLADRVDKMVDDGLIEEVKAISERYGWDAPGLAAPGYKALRNYLEGTMTLDEAKAQFVRNDLDLAKRQRSWFKRNKYIHWVSTPEEAYVLTEQFLT